MNIFVCVFLLGKNHEWCSNPNKEVRHTYQREKNGQCDNLKRPADSSLDSQKMICLEFLIGNTTNYKLQSVIQYSVPLSQTPQDIKPIKCKDTM
jgi:predicted amidophosphoribosyltransferase